MRRKPYQNDFTRQELSIPQHLVLSANPKGSECIHNVYESLSNFFFVLLERLPCSLWRHLTLLLSGRPFFFSLYRNTSL